MHHKKYHSLIVVLLLFIQVDLFGDNLIFTITHSTSASSNDGAILLNVTGGAPDFYFDWIGPSITM